LEFWAEAWARHLIDVEWQQLGGEPSFNPVPQVAEMRRQPTFEGYRPLEAILLAGWFLARRELRIKSFAAGLGRVRRRLSPARSTRWEAGETGGATTARSAPAASVRLSG